MKPEYTIAVDNHRALLVVTLRGQFDEATVDAWGADRRRAIERMNVPRNQHFALYDATDLVLPSQAAFVAIQRHMADPATMSRRAAGINGSAIQRLQNSRMTQHPAVGIFEDRDEAEAWLFADDSTPES